MTSIVPTFHDLSFYSDPSNPSIKKRYDKLLSEFNNKYDSKPEFISRSPGRVNLIGDHIDYCYFSCLPMALDADVIIAVGTNDSGEIQLRNTSSNFEHKVVTLPKDGSVIEINQAEFSWANYFKCGLIVAHKYILENHSHLINKGSALKGLNLLFDGNVPTGGGLSSSAAICVASTLAVLRANGVKEVSKADLTKITVVSEHYVGVNTGGLDQCASIYGGKNKALLVQFKPELGGHQFSLPTLKPNDLVFLVTNSLVEANKHETAPVNYNLRAVEAAVSAEILAYKFNLKLTPDSNLSTGTLRGFLDDYFEKIEKAPKWDVTDIYTGSERLGKLLELIETLYTKDEKIGFTTEEAARSVGLTLEDFKAKFLSKFPVKYDKLKIYQRTHHVLADSKRVLDVLKLLEDATSNSTETLEQSEEFLQKVGSLFQASQKSNQYLMENSKPECDDLVSIALRNGSYGSRVTGAGFGGSIVHLTTTDKVETLVEALEREYYNKYLPNLTDTELKNAILVSKPSTGSCVVEL